MLFLIFEEFDGSFLVRAFFYRKGLRVFCRDLSLNKQPYMKWSLSLKAPNIGIIFSSYTLIPNILLHICRVTTVYWPAKINKSQIYLFQLELWDSGETATRKYNHILPVLLWTFLSLMFTQVTYLCLVLLQVQKCFRLVQTFCARQKDDLHSVFFFVPAQKFLKRY